MNVVQEYPNVYTSTQVYVIVELDGKFHLLTNAKRESWVDVVSGEEFDYTDELVDFLWHCSAYGKDGTPYLKSALSALECFNEKYGG
jgi:hypothetical protein